LGINPQTLDLNLLRVLVTLSECRSVSQAAETIGVSQPAISNALARLRDATGDKLFVRSKAGMLPTPYAEQILPGVKTHLAGLLEALAGDNSFHPSTSNRLFRLSLSGLGELVFLPQLVKETFKTAPNIRFLNVSSPLPDLAHRLEKGEIDCAIGIITLSARGIRTRPLFEEEYVAIAGPELKKEPRTIDELRGEKFAVSAPSVSYGTDMRRFIRRIGLEANVMVHLANFAALAQLLMTLPMVSIVPGRFARQLTTGTDLRALPIRFELSNSVANLIWHERTDDDAANVWLRQRLIKLHGAEAFSGNAG